MSTKALSCSCCGNMLTFPEDVAVIECPACGTSCAAPHATGDMLLTLQRAVEQRLACDFHSAELSYQQVLLFHPDEHEALWGRLLCHYGVEYVEDPVSRRRMPTVRTVRPKPLQEQADFRKACEFAPSAVRAQYEQDARYIDDAQAEIRHLAVSCASYDVFLCHKTTRPGSSDYTQDFHRATQLYHFLKDQGVRVFFAPECLQGAAGSNYEAGIYHVLQTAKVMLLVCSQAEYLTSAWVRSEWTRFLDLVDEDPARQIIPLFYDHFSPSALPQPFILRRIQGLDMTDINAPQTLLALVARSVGSAQQEAAPAHAPAAEPARPVAPSSAPAPNAAPEQANGMQQTLGQITRGIGVGVQKLLGAAKRPGGIGVGVQKLLSAAKRPEKQDASAPEAAPQPQYTVTLTFPEPYPEWKTIPLWAVTEHADLRKDGTTSSSWSYMKRPFQQEAAVNIQWNKTITVPIDQPETKLYFGEDKHETTLLELSWKVIKALFHLALLAFSVFMTLSGVISPFIPSFRADIGIGGSLALLIFGLIFTFMSSGNLEDLFCFERTLHRVSSGKPIEVQAGKHYDLSWSPMGARLIAKER